MEKVKITFSKYCASGFYGDDCKCIRCCKKFNREYNQVEEHKNWVYAKVMKGESFIIDGVKPMVYFHNNKPKFGMEFTYFYNGSISFDNGQCKDCLFYESNGFCSHTNSKDICADRDSDSWCDIKSFKKRKLNERN